MLLSLRTSGAAVSDTRFRMLLIPDDPAAAYYRNGLLTHFCLNPFGPSRKKPFCSEGCITASQDDINALN
jgi:hypothetical protein